MPLTQASGRTAIEQLQAKLNYYAGAGLAVDGSFGPKTLAAVQAWERGTNVPTQYRTNGYSVSDYTLASLGINISAPAPSGGGNHAPAAGALSFAWQVPAVVGYTTLSWDQAIATLKSALQREGFSNLYVSWTTLSLSPLVSWNYALIVQGTGPVGLLDQSALSNRLLAQAEGAGFNLNRNGATLSASASGGGGNNAGAGSGGGGNPNKSPFDSSTLVMVGAGLLVLALVLRD